jgi:N-methylhydantoinase B/oxoprolinase/acetone carboxylase alpha subunit
LNGVELTAFPALILQPGDVIELRLGGGGGFGRSEERRSEDILEDIKQGYVTTPAAEAEYHLSDRGDGPGGTGQ